jgi:hypothetical protein
MKDLIKTTIAERHTTDIQFEKKVIKALQDYCNKYPNDSDLGKEIRKQTNKK